jgi:hypothetical protein
MSVEFGDDALAHLLAVGPRGAPHSITRAPAMASRRAQLPADARRAARDQRDLAQVQPHQDSIQPNVALCDPVASAMEEGR